MPNVQPISLACPDVLETQSSKNDKTIHKSSKNVCFDALINVSPCVIDVVLFSKWIDVSCEVTSPIIKSLLWPYKHVVARCVGVLYMITFNKYVEWKKNSDEPTCKLNRSRKKKHELSNQLQINWQHFRNSHLQHIGFGQWNYEECLMSKLQTITQLLG